MDSSMLDNIPKIRGVIRKRPQSKKELKKGDNDVTSVKDNQNIYVRENKTKVDLTPYIEEHEFIFDNVFDENINNEEIYEEVVRPLVLAVFMKSKVTCFAYGQTGSGKTYTMMGYEKLGVKGQYILAADDIFKVIRQPRYKNLSIWVSFYEIYCGKAHDLLAARKECFIRVDAKENVHIVKLTEQQLKNVDQMMEIISKGMSVRQTGTTGANDDSSRSHAVLEIHLRENATGKTYGKMSFIDLAGSERGADVKDNEKQTRRDGAEINKSLLALKECIRALDQDKGHTPFRGSKLTLVLRDSFIGNNCKTVMIGNISPAISACEHTLNTLRYADRVKELKAPGEPREKGDAKDELAKALMLPRLNKNTKIIQVKKNMETRCMIADETGDNDQGDYVDFNKSFDKEENNSNVNESLSMKVKPMNTQGQQPKADFLDTPFNNQNQFNMQYMNNQNVNGMGQGQNMNFNNNNPNNNQNNNPNNNPNFMRMGSFNNTQTFPNNQNNFSNNQNPFPNNQYGSNNMMKPNMNFNNFMYDNQNQNFNQNNYMNQNFNQGFSNSPQNINNVNFGQMNNNQTGLRGSFKNIQSMDNNMPMFNSTKQSQDFNNTMPNNNKEKGTKQSQEFGMNNTMSNNNKEKAINFNSNNFNRTLSLNVDQNSMKKPGSAKDTAFNLSPSKNVIDPKEIDSTSENSTEKNQKLVLEREEIQSNIIQTEEELMQEHKLLIDNFVGNLKLDMELFQNPEQLDDIPSYSLDLLSLLTEKEQMIKTLKDKVLAYHNDLEREKDLNKKLKKHDTINDDLLDLDFNENPDGDLLLDGDDDQLL